MILSPFTPGYLAPLGISYPVARVHFTPSQVILLHPLILWKRTDRTHARLHPSISRLHFSFQHFHRATPSSSYAPIHLLTSPFFGYCCISSQALTLLWSTYFLRAYWGAWLTQTGIVQSLKLPPLRGGEREPTWLS
jgi:hypothetical protein